MGEKIVNNLEEVFFNSLNSIFRIRGSLNYTFNELTFILVKLLNTDKLYFKKIKIT